MSGPAMFCFRNDSRMATIMPVSSVSRKTIKKTGAGVRGVVTR